MIMMDQSERLAQPLRWTRAGKIAVALVGVCLLLSLGAWAVYGLGGDTRGGASEGCIDVSFPSTLGGANLHACGGKARTVCAAPVGYKGMQDALRVACGRAGYAFGARPAIPSSS